MAQAHAPQAPLSRVMSLARGATVAKLTGGTGGLVRRCMEKSKMFLCQKPIKPSQLSPQTVPRTVHWIYPLKLANPLGSPNHCSNYLVPPHREPTFNSVFSLPRNQKLPPEKQTPEALYLAEGGSKEDNNLTVLTETLLSEKPTLAPGEMDTRCRDVPLVRLPDPQESES